MSTPAFNYVPWPHFHYLDRITVTDPESRFFGRCGVIERVYPRSVAVAIWTGAWPPPCVEIQKTGVSLR